MSRRMERHEAEAYVDRRLVWDKAVVNTPHRCPNCGEGSQVQIRNTMDQGGPLWKCRMCSHKFHTAKPENVPEP